MSFVIAEPCVDVHDRGCVDECPVDCIYDGVRKGYIQPDECVDCGAQTSGRSPPTIPRSPRSTAPPEARSRQGTG